MTEITSQFVEVENLRLHFLQAQPQNSIYRSNQPTILFLHGFPEHSGVWKSQLSYFGQQYQTLALDLPGYNLSQAPFDLTGFSVPSLVKIIAAFIQNVSPDKPIVLVAHDWGGALAWPLTNRFPELIDKLVILNAAHPSTFTREMISNRQQRLLSDYIHTFLVPEAEQRLIKNRFAELKAHSIDNVRVKLSEQDITDYERAWSQPNAVTNMLNYYRAMPQLFPREGSVGSNLEGSPEKPLDSIKVPHIDISVPTLVLWGEQDQAFDIDVLNGLADYIADYQEYRFADASHWLHHEKPEEVNQAIDLFLRR